MLSPQGTERQSMNALDLGLAYARTTAGESELQQASHGLSLVQRKLLTALDGMTPANQLNFAHQLEPELVERSVARLADLGLAAASTASAAPVSFGRFQPAKLRVCHCVAK
jgi:hypothetical protein